MIDIVTCMPYLNQLLLITDVNKLLVKNNNSNHISYILKVLSTH